MNDTITADRLSDFVDLVRVVVTNGIRFRHTVDTALRHSLPPMERELLEKAERLSHDLKALALEVVSEEGGVA